MTAPDVLAVFCAVADTRGDLCRAVGPHEHHDHDEVDRLNEEAAS